VAADNQIPIYSGVKPLFDPMPDAPRTAEDAYRQKFNCAPRQANPLKIERSRSKTEEEREEADNAAWRRMRYWVIL
jgi:hypothetical protein